MPPPASEKNASIWQRKGIRDGGAEDTCAKRTIKVSRLDHLWIGFNRGKPTHKQTTTTDSFQRAPG